MPLPEGFFDKNMRIVTELLIDRALNEACQCGQMKMLKRPFCTKCIDELMRNGFRDILRLAWREYQLIPTFGRCQAPLLYYDIGCDLLSAIASGRYVRRRGGKRNEEEMYA